MLRFSRRQHAEAIGLLGGGGGEGGGWGDPNIEILLHFLGYGLKGQWALVAEYRAIHISMYDGSSPGHILPFFNVLIKIIYVHNDLISILVSVFVMFIIPDSKNC